MTILMTVMTKQMNNFVVRLYLVIKICIESQKNFKDCYFKQH